MTCNDCSALLSQYIDHEMSTQEELKIREHLSKCAKCKEEYEVLCHTIDCVCSNLECVEPPMDFHHRVMAKINEHHRAVKVRWPLWGSLTFASLAAAALLLVTLLFTPFQHPAHFAKLALNSQPAVKTAQPVNVPKLAQPWEDFGQESDMVAKNNVTVPSASETLTLPSSMVRAVAFGDQADSRNSAPVQTQADSPLLYRQNHEWSGEDSTIKVLKHFTINTPEQAKQLWDTSGITPLPLENMDWNTNALAVLFIGAKPGRGYDIQIKRIENQADRMMVFYHVNSPKATTATGTSHPFIAFEVKKSSLPIEFTED